ncbi:MAG: hypothetical protein O2960_28570 [Verrucomicrobia bacterium]|nr:hypothetical protein [Verrucomicrobiota bacterium]
MDWSKKERWENDGNGPTRTLRADRFEPIVSPKMPTPPNQTGMPRIKPGRRLSMQQVLDIQALTHAAAMGLGEDFRGTSDREERARVAMAISSLGKSWTTLQDSKREILGRPKAGVLKPERKRTGRKQQASETLTIEAIAASMS